MLVGHIRMHFALFTKEEAFGSVLSLESMDLHYTIKRKERLDYSNGHVS